ncbi:MAG: hypothetical protein EU549_01970 [Promethearchaeota archaeon]|nr:MAG: hypothetical protein EU549_01970 [Candidatus Lokiarchaeota archaeon]
MIYDNIYNYLDEDNPISLDIKKHLIFYFMQNIDYIIKLLNAPESCPTNHPDFLIEAIDPESFEEFLRLCEMNFDKLVKKISTNLSLLKLPTLFRGTAANAIKIIYSSIINEYQNRYEDICMNYCEK